MLSDYVLSATNTNVHAYGTSPFYATVEVTVLAAMRAVMGLPEQGDGIFCPGGSYSNLVAMLAARERCVPVNTVVSLPWVQWTRNCQESTLRSFVLQGLVKAAVSGRRLVVLTSQQSHYSIKRAVAVLGLGHDAMVLVDCLPSGAMDPADFGKLTAVTTLLYTCACVRACVSAFTCVYRAERSLRCFVAPSSTRRQTNPVACCCLLQNGGWKRRTLGTTSHSS
jgi:glutamate/tyrosine decarboxylase-like PLP-dependent enzyme